MHKLTTIIWMYSLGVMMGMVFEQNVNFYHTKVRQAIAECEKSLPRDQECQVIILANPKENK